MLFVGLGEAVEYPADRVGCNSDTRIRDLEAQPNSGGSVFHGIDGKNHNTLIGEFYGIARQIEQHRMQMTPIATHQ